MLTLKNLASYAVQRGAAFEEAERIRSELQAEITDDDFGPRWETWFGAEALRREAVNVLEIESAD